MMSCSDEIKKNNMDSPPGNLAVTNLKYLSYPDITAYFSSVAEILQVEACILKERSQIEENYAADLDHWIKMSRSRLFFGPPAASEEIPVLHILDQHLKETKDLSVDRKKMAQNIQANPEGCYRQLRILTKECKTKFPSGATESDLSNLQAQYYALFANFKRLLDKCFAIRTNHSVVMGKLSRLAKEQNRMTGFHPNPLRKLGKEAQAEVLVSKYDYLIKKLQKEATDVEKTAQQFCNHLIDFETNRIRTIKDSLLSYYEDIEIAMHRKVAVMPKDRVKRMIQEMDPQDVATRWLEDLLVLPDLLLQLTYDANSRDSVSSSDSDVLVTNWRAGSDSSNGTPMLSAKSHLDPENNRAVCTISSTQLSPIGTIHGFKPFITTAWSSEKDISRTKQAETNINEALAGHQTRDLDTEESLGSSSKLSTSSFKSSEVFAFDEEIQQALQAERKAVTATGGIIPTKDYGKDFKLDLSQGANESEDLDYFKDEFGSAGYKKQTKQQSDSDISETPETSTSKEATTAFQRLARLKSVMSNIKKGTEGLFHPPRWLPRSLSHLSEDAVFEPWNKIKRPNTKAPPGFIKYTDVHSTIRFSDSDNAEL